MTDRDVDNILQRAAEAPHEVDAAMVKRVSGMVLPSLRPVRPMPPSWAIALGLQLIFLAVAILGATRMGFNGVRVLNRGESSAIFWVLGSLGLMAASAGAVEMIPGSKSRFSPRVLLASCTVAFAGMFAVMFHDYRMDRFVSEGLACLEAGLLHAAGAGLLLWLVMRRGLILNPIPAGVAAGTLAGLAGFGMLELHCPILKAMHLMVWHTAVIPLSGLGGYLIGRAVTMRP